MLEREIASGAAGLVAIPQSHPWYVDRAWFQSARDKLVKAVRLFHAKQPLLPGIAKQDLRSRELPGAPLFVMDALLGEARELVVEGETVRLRGHQVVLKEEEEQARAAIERAFEEAGLATPAMAEVLAKSAVEPGRARKLLEILLREKRLVRISEELVFHQTALASLREMLAGRRSERFNVGAFKEWTGISRKYAIPLLEFLDRERVTRRDGDERVVL
jgi:selenocysteine-specific elongation factor